jgi:MFS family permease
MDINLDLRHAKSDNSIFSTKTFFSTATTDPLIKGGQDVITFPEGGKKAWLVVFGSWCALFSSLGIMNTMGAFHEHISTHHLVHYKVGTVGWIFSLYAFLTFGVSLFVGPVFDKYGPRWLILAGSISVTASTALIGVSRGTRQTQMQSF